MAAVATDAVNTAYHGIVRRAEVKKEETVFLFGLGGLGFNALQVVRYIGARVIVSDLRSEKLELAVQKGVPREDVVSVGKGIPEFVVDNGLQGKIDTVLDFVGSHQTFHDAQHIGESSFFFIHSYTSMYTPCRGEMDGHVADYINSPTWRKDPLRGHPSPPKRS